MMPEGQNDTADLGPEAPYIGARIPIRLSRRTSTRRNQQIRRNMEMFAQTPHHRHAQFALAGHDFTDATRGTQKRHKISAG